MPAVTVRRVACGPGYLHQSQRIGKRPRNATNGLRAVLSTRVAGPEGDGRSIFLGTVMSPLLDIRVKTYSGIAYVLAY